MVAPLGETSMAIAGGAITVIAAAADLLLSATELALSVTVPGVLAGAV
jgi:hypothetical protein